MAVHELIGEIYASGYFSSTTLSDTAKKRREFGDYADAAPYLSLWWLNNLSKDIDKTATGFANHVAALIGEEPPRDTNPSGYWIFGIIGSKASTAFNADGFVFYYFPEATTSGKPVVAVTYKVNSLNIPAGADRAAFDSALMKNGKYDSNGGYNVYHLVVA